MKNAHFPRSIQNISLANRVVEIPTAEPKQIYTYVVLYRGNNVKQMMIDNCQSGNLFETRICVREF